MNLLIKGISLFQFLLLAFLATLNAVPANAQENENWKLICQKEDDPRTCRIEQRLFMNQKVDGETKNVGQVLNVSVFYTGKDERKPFILMQLPLGVDLRAGMAMQVDSSRQMKAPFVKCTKAGCEVQSIMTPELLAQLKKGTTMKVGFRPYGVTKTMVVDVNLIGFTRAFSWLD